jgi:hypothetical protein
MGLVLVLTISLGIGFGVVSGYLIISGILNMFARKPESGKSAPELAAQGIAGD